jgi:hypothetical protein
MFEMRGELGSTSPFSTAMMFSMSETVRLCAAASSLMSDIRWSKLPWVARVSG